MEIKIANNYQARALLTVTFSKRSTNNCSNIGYLARPSYITDITLMNLKSIYSLDISAINF